jgi:hypothetical protein
MFSGFYLVCVFTQHGWQEMLNNEEMYILDTCNARL